MVIQIFKVEGEDLFVLQSQNPFFTEDAEIVFRMQTYGEAPLHFVSVHYHKRRDSSLQYLNMYQNKVFFIDVMSPET